MKCKYCHEVFATNEGLKAHISGCFYQNNPLPEPQKEEQDKPTVKKTTKKRSKK